GAQLVDGDDAGVLELAADLRLLHEALDHPDLALVRLQEHLDGDVAAQVGVAPLEHGPHAAPGDLAQELITADRLALPWRLFRAGLAHGGGCAVVRVAEVPVRHRWECGPQ